MKILSLRFKNLNSLYGEWLIDFTDSEYESHGIFALTGPTGAGKSTILDAICLALYGATPRLGRITQSTNDIMSRQTGECFAEVVFVSQAGKYRCRWDQRRARRAPAGNLQHQEHQISEADTGQLIEDKKSRVGAVIEEKTGMDFERFTRSVLLAQGSFDTFLKADPEQKSKILEQITGTEVYTEISRLVHDRLRNEKESLTILQAEIAKVGLLSSDQEHSMQQDLAAKQQTHAMLNQEMVTLTKAYEWLNTKAELKYDIQKLADQYKILQAKLQDFEPKRQQLILATKAAGLDGSYATLNAMRQQQYQDQVELTQRTQQLLQLEQATQKQTQLLQAAQQHTDEIKDQLKTARPLMQKIRLFDQQLLAQYQTRQQEKNRAEKITEIINQYKKQFKLEKDKQAQIQQQYQKIQDYIEKHQSDAWLISGLSALEQQFETVFSQQSELAERQKTWQEHEKKQAQAKQTYQQSIKQCQIISQDLVHATQQREQAQIVLNQSLQGRLLREYRADKDHLISEKFYLLKIAELTEYRAQLESGSPCPLCGATDHPYKDEQPIAPNIIQEKIEKLERFIQKIEDQQLLINQLEQTEFLIQQQLATSEKTKVSHKYALDLMVSAQTQLELDIGQRISALNNLKKNLEEKLHAFGITEVSYQDERKLLNSLQIKQQQWQQHIAYKTQLETELGKLESEANHLLSLLENHSQTLSEQEAHLSYLQSTYDAALLQRENWYGTKDPDQQERSLTQALAAAEHSQQLVTKQHTQLQQQWIAAITHTDSLRHRIDQRSPELKRLEEDFSHALKQIGFVDEEAWQAAQLSVSQREQLTAQTKTLDDENLAIKTQEADKKSRLELERAKEVTDQSVDQIALMREELAQNITDLTTALTELTYALQQNTNTKVQIQSKQLQIESQQKECHRWEKLHRLIGSADGKKYRNFAQGLTFELMVRHANKQLEKMTDRYLLMHDATEPLSLNVIDNYQAGEIRSTKNLSGGECFIVSLSLALGLSKMASRKVRVDSLFLDEGFGTLDEDALDTALGTLSGLQQENKLIGVISHVPALKERIATQITVQPTHGGRSQIQGPGCARV